MGDSIQYSYSSATPLLAGVFKDAYSAGKSYGPASSDRTTYPVPKIQVSVVESDSKMEAGVES